MSAAKHTPGPWTVHPGQGAKEIAQIRSADGRVVAVIPHPSLHGEAAVADFYERAANARLIAMLPELLARAGGAA